MSCHDIGRGMASVGEKVLTLYDSGRIDRDTPKELLEATIKGVNWCDGNEYEAEVSMAGRCAHCLEKATSPEQLVFGNDYFADESFPGCSDRKESISTRFVKQLYSDRKLLAPSLCHKCLAEFLEAEKGDYVPQEWDTGSSVGAEI